MGASLGPVIRPVCRGGHKEGPIPVARMERHVIYPKSWLPEVGGSLLAVHCTLPSLLPLSFQHYFHPSGSLPDLDLYLYNKPGGQGTGGKGTCTLGLWPGSREPLSSMETAWWGEEAWCIL